MEVSLAARTGPGKEVHVSKHHLTVKQTASNYVEIPGTEYIPIGCC